MQALVFLTLGLRSEVWLVLSVFASQPSTLANYSLVLLLWWSFDHEQVEDVGVLAVKLVIGLVARVFSQLESLSTGTILRPGTDKAVWPGWIVLDRDLRDDWPFW